MIGKTDFDLTEAERAKELYAREQEIMRSGQPQLDLEESLVDVSGAERWFSTSKVPLRDADGEIIGLAGVTRDITEQRRLGASRGRRQLFGGCAVTRGSAGPRSTSTRVKNPPRSPRWQDKCERENFYAGHHQPCELRKMVRTCMGDLHAEQLRRHSLAIPGEAMGPATRRHR